MNPSIEEAQERARVLLLRALGFDEFQLIAAKVILDQLNETPVDYANLTPEQEDLLIQLGRLGIEAGLDE